MAFDDKIEYNQAGTVLTMHCTDGSVKVFDRKAVMPAQRWRTDPEYVWELRTMTQYAKGWTDAGIPILRDAAWGVMYYKDNAARKWYYETQIRPHWKKEGK